VSDPSVTHWAATHLVTSTLADALDQNPTLRVLVRHLYRAVTRACHRNRNCRIRGLSKEIGWFYSEYLGWLNEFTRPGFGRHIDMIPPCPSRSIQPDSEIGGRDFSRLSQPSTVRLTPDVRNVMKSRTRYLTKLYLTALGFMWIYRRWIRSFSHAEL